MLRLLGEDFSQEQAQLFKDLDGDFMTSLKFIPVDLKTSGDEGIPKLLCHAARKEGVIGPMALKDRKAFTVRNGRKPGIS